MRNSFILILKNRLVSIIVTVVVKALKLILQTLIPPFILILYSKRHILVIDNPT